jgi:hypothetical protein
MRSNMTVFESFFKVGIAIVECEFFATTRTPPPLGGRVSG